MAKAEKVLEGAVQIEAFVGSLSGWLQKAIKIGAVRVTAQNVDDVEEPKSDPQRGKFHAMIGDIQKTGVILMPGRKVRMSDYDTDRAKALLVMWFANEKAEIGEPLKKPPQTFLDPISGQSITIRPSTAQWGKKLTCEFVEFLYATGTMAGVKWSEVALQEYSSYREAQQ